MMPTGFSVSNDDVPHMSGAADVIALPVIPPFHLEGTVRLLQRRPSNRVDRWRDGRYLRVLDTEDGLRLITVENVGTIEDPDLRCLVAGGTVSSPTLEAVSGTVRRILGLDVDLAPFYVAARQFLPLHLAVEALRGVRPPRFPTLFETLTNVVPFQQVSLAASAAVVGRIVERCGLRLKVDHQVYYAFPRPESVSAMDVSELHLLGLSRAKAATLHDLAMRILSGELREEQLEELSSESVMETLTALPGIGPWSAGLVLLRGLGRMEIFPAGDVGAAKNLSRLLELGRPTSRRDLQPYIERMGSVKGFLYFYALGRRLQEEGLISPVPGAVY
jgi:3-methyladenine DNA glycosylase/8-oxoguanine DNA glycosylase